MGLAVNVLPASRWQFERASLIERGIFQKPRKAVVTNYTKASAGGTSAVRYRRNGRLWMNHADL